MDIYAITEYLGKDPTSRTARTNINQLLRRHGIQPLRRNSYDREQIDQFKTIYDSGAYDGRKHPKKRKVSRVRS